MQQLQVPEQTQQIDINLIEATSATQSRVGLDENTIVEYAEAMEGGASFPPILLFFDGDKYYLADGFHRVYACKRANLDTIAAFVHAGSRRDALLYSAGANALHGLRRSNADKRHAVEILLRDEEWSKWSDREIARCCGVSNRFVSNMRSELSVNGSQMQERTVNRNGVTYTQNVGNIGHSQALKIHKSGIIDVEAESLGLVENDDQFEPTQGDHIDELTHASLVDVEDKLGVLQGGAITDSVEAAVPESSGDAQGDDASMPTQMPPQHAPFISNKSDEYCTPPEVLDAVIGCFGTIDLDPCSNSHGTPNVPAARHYTKEDGFDRNWNADTLFLHPPSSQEKLWVVKLLYQYQAGNVREAIALFKADTSTSWFQMLWDYGPICFVKGRLKFIGNDDSATFPWALVYLGENVGLFRSAMERNLGVVVQRVPGAAK